MAETRQAPLVKAAFSIQHSAFSPEKTAAVKISPSELNSECKMLNAQKSAVSMASEGETPLMIILGHWDGRKRSLPWPEGFNLACLTAEDLVLAGEADWAEIRKSGTGRLLHIVRNQ